MAVWMLFMFAATLATVQCSWVLSLDMALDSIDDAYVHCTEKMSKLVKEYYLVREMNTNAKFRNAWCEAQIRAKPGDGLGKEQAVALWVYTSNTVYSDFNRAVGNGTTVRFGRFASSSWDANANVKFGDKTCFIIHTKFGANISKFSVYKQEKEVLIPPYETFRVISVQYRMYNPYLWCEVVYTLKSVGIQSYLNCALCHKVNHLY
ncbi:ecto-ADP-ribosyltransferase 5-like [Chanos chanos]|uniref:NAD(P)(+)--arginine ADP-ribosyltransferase n=1 Tax=Chanos chanos TaxID=29144 RepID=A0A6J2VPL1_CHACN|nr:ecto-ADP-ribosyltransferase 5-like [Chanos chanos]